MAERIPQRIDHFRYTDKGVILEGIITSQESLDAFPRLAEAVKSIGDIEYRLKFDVDMLSNRIVSGFVKTQVLVTCQRCMNDFSLALDCEIATAFVQNDFELKNAESSDYDVCFVEKKVEKKDTKKKLFLEPGVLLEDELLLALPQIAKHPEQDIGTHCQIQQFDSFAEQTFTKQKSAGQDSTKQQIKDGPGSDNPFAILEQLKK